jgi:hypothetical protein
MNKDIILKSDESTSALSVNGKIYDLQSLPDYNDPLVLKQKNELLLQIDLNELTENLYLSVELLYVAYNGVAGAQGGKLQSDINLLMGDLALLCNKCVGTMSSFKDESQNIINELGQTYRWLLKGKEKLAIAKLKHCGESSRTMAIRADQLSEEFLKLQKRSVAVRSDTILEEATENDKKEAAQKAIRELESTRIAEKINQEELVEQVSKMQVLYDDAKEREEKASEKALIMGITSAITGAIGAGLGAFLSAKNPMSNIASKPDNKADNEKVELAQKYADEKKKKSMEANNTLLELKNELIPAKNKLETLQKKESELKTQLSINNSVGESIRTNEQKEKLETLNTELISTTKEIEIVNVEIKKLDAEIVNAEKTAKDNTDECGAAAAALNKISGSMDTMAASATSAEESIHQEKMSFLKKKFELETEKRKSLIAMANFTEGIKNAKVEEGNAEVSVHSLHAAVGAMGKIVGTLTNASLFWKQMAEFCTKMAEKGFQSELKDLIDPENGLSSEERIEEYQDVFFMKSFLEYLCQWVALNGLSGEYLVSASNAQKKCVENLSKSPSIEEARRSAPELAKSMGIMINQKIVDSNTESSGILIEQARLEAAES